MSQVSLAPDASISAAEELDIATFRAAMRELAGGVAVVTVGQGGDITGFTATSVASLSARPPRLLVCVSQTSSSWQALQRHASFAVNLLSDADRLLADRFAGRDGLENAARFAGFPWSTMATGTPVFDAVPAALDCDVEEMLPRYDHAILIGKVRAVRLSAGTAPLAYWRGDYHPLSPGDDRTN